MTPSRRFRGGARDWARSAARLFTSVTRRWVRSTLLRVPNIIPEDRGRQEQPSTMEPSDWIRRDTEIMYWALLGIFVQYDPIQPTAEPSSVIVMSLPPMHWIAVLAI